MGFRLGVYEFARGFSFRQFVPPLIHRKRSPITFYGIAATGSYDHFDSLRDAPPGGEGLVGYRSLYRSPLYTPSDSSFPKLSVTAALSAA